MGVLEVLFGVGFGGGDAVKRFVEDADDSPLFGEGRNRNVCVFDFTGKCSAVRYPLLALPVHPSIDRKK